MTTTIRERDTHRLREIYSAAGHIETDLSDAVYYNHEYCYWFRTDDVMAASGKILTPCFPLYVVTLAPIKKAQFQLVSSNKCIKKYRPTMISISLFSVSTSLTKDLQ